MTKNLATLQIIPLIILLPLLAMSCDVGRAALEAVTYTGDIDELGMAFNLADEWVQGEYDRNTSGRNYQRWLDSVPQNVHYIYEKHKPENPEFFTGGSNFYIHTDVNEDNVHDLMVGEKEHFYRYSLSIDLKTTKSPEALELWREGKCRDARQPDVPKLCQGETDMHRLIRRLDASEIPFEADAGYLFESDFQYGSEVDMASKELIYYFYVVKENRSYRIRLRGVEVGPEEILAIQENRLLSEQPIADMISSIRFL